MTDHCDWPRLIAAFALELRAQGCTAETIRTRMSYIRRWTQNHRPDATRAEVVEWLACEGWAPATRKSAQASLRKLYKTLVKAGHLSCDPTVDLGPVRVPARLPRPASEEQVEAGRNADSADVRLMVELAAGMGLRRAEIAQVRREDVLPSGKLHIRGKGGKDRHVWLPPAVRAELAARPPGFVFPGRFTGHIHPATVQKKIRRAAGVAPHAHRHRFATRSFAVTKDLLALQKILGHDSPETTQIYVQVGEEAHRAAVMAAAA